MYDVNQAMVNQYFKMIKQSGYVYSKDSNGSYFDNGTKRFSVIKTGPFMTTYYNKKKSNRWVLQDKMTATLKTIDCLQWILKKIQSNA
jgi:DNA-binding transcriptional regulator YhcF (GntR family)